MKTIAKLVRPNKEKVKIFGVLVLLWMAISSIDYAAGQYYNIQYGMQGNGNTPFALDLLMRVMIVLSFPLQFLSMLVFLPICPYFGDSSQATHGCGGPLPESLSLVLYYLFQLATLYLIAIIWVAVSEKRSRKSK